MVAIIAASRRSSATASGGIVEKLSQAEGTNECTDSAAKLSSPTIQRGTRMKKTLLAGLLLSGISFVGVPAVPAQTGASGSTASAGQNQASVDQDVALLRQDLRSKKKQLIAANLTLTDGEATKFWPVYDQYSAELTKLGDQKYALIKEYAQGFGTLTNDQALSLLNRSLALDEKIVQLRLKYVPIVNQVLPGTKTATFFQMDRRITALLDLQLAAEIPFVQDQK
jgi:hypothetical protein